MVPGHGLVKFGPSKQARDLASSYMKSERRSYRPPRVYTDVNVARAAKIANEYEVMTHEPRNKKVATSYRSLIAETLRQYEVVKRAGLKIDVIRFEKTGDPYAASPRLVQIDVRDNNHLWLLPTDAALGYGALDPAYEDSPLLRPVDEVIDDYQLVVNDIFRIVHDYFGHVKEGVGFRARGEENAWRCHAAMYSRPALGALTSELRGQNSWLNYGPHGDTNRTASAIDTVFAIPKIGLMPEWTWDRGRTDPGP